jgi:Uma2 family endonuclease
MTGLAKGVTIGVGGANMVAVTTLDDVQVSEPHRMTVEEYLAVVEVLGWERTELIEGVVYDMAAQYDLHAGTAAHIFRAVDALFPDDRVRFGSTVRLGPFTAVDPDVFVFDGSATYDRYGIIPGQLLKLVVEVSVSTLTQDLGRKLRAYARAGVPQYWVVDPRSETGILLRHTEPVGDSHALVRRFEVGEGAEALDAAAVLAID